MSSEDAIPQTARPKETKRDQILIMKLPEGSVVFEGIPSDLGKFFDTPNANPTIAHIETPHAESTAPTTETSAAPPSEMHRRRLHRRNRRRISKMYAFNVLFIVFVTLTSLIPALLSTFLKVEIYTAATDAPFAKIATHDVMITQITPAADLRTNDVMIVRNDYTWKMEIRQVSSVAFAGDLANVSTNSGANSSEGDSYTIDKTTLIHKVIRTIPSIGFWLLLFTSVYAKIIGGGILVIVNVIVHMRRLRRARETMSR